MGWLDKVASKITNELGATGLDDNDRSELELANAYVDRHGFLEAEPRILGLLDRHPRSPQVLRAAAELAAAQGQTEAAVTLFGRAVDNAPEDSVAWLRLAQLLLILHRHDPALTAARRALQFCDRENFVERDRIAAEATLVQARVALAQNRLPDARAAFDQARALGVPDASVAHELGTTLLPVDKDQAAKWFVLAASGSQASPAVALQAARLQPSAQSANDLLHGFLERFASAAATRPLEFMPLRARLARGLSQLSLADAANAQLAFFDPMPDELDAEACVDLAEAYATLGHFVQAAAWSLRAEKLGSYIDVDKQLAWALGTNDLGTLQELGPRIEQRAPLYAALIHDAFATKANPVALEQLLVHAPITVVENWAAYAAPHGAADSHTRALLEAFVEIVRSMSASDDLLWSATRARANLDRPFIVALLGEFNAGKSTLVNCLVGADLAPVGVKPTTATLTTFRCGVSGAHVVYRSDTGRKTRQLSTAQLAAFLSMLSDEDAAQIDTVEIIMPEVQLSRFEWVDTPGLNAPRDAHELITRRFMNSADIVIWVLSAQQAAKASEVSVLNELFAAHTPVLALLNKIDQVEPEDLPTVHASVQAALGTSVFAIVPSSLRTPAAAQSCRALVLEQLESFTATRGDELKQRSALASLLPLVADARTRAETALPLDHTLAADAATWEPMAATIDQKRNQLSAQHNEGLKRATALVLDGLTVTAGKPSEDSVAELMRKHLEQLNETIVSGLQDLPVEIRDVYTALCERYVAQSQGRLEGGLAELVLKNSGARETQRRYLEQALPDPARFLWQPWGEKVRAVAQSQNNLVRQRRAKLVAAQALHSARFTNPLRDLETDAKAAWARVVERLSPKATVSEV